MSIWDRFRKYADEGPGSPGDFALLAFERYRELVAEAVTPVLSGRGWRSDDPGSRWTKPLSSWVTVAIEFPLMKGGELAVRWGLLLSFVPNFKGARAGFGEKPIAGRALDLSYDPLDYERDLSPWGLSRFAREAEVRADAVALAVRSDAEASAFAGSCSIDLGHLLRCFREKQQRKYLRFGFYHYPQEVLAFAFALFVSGEKEQALVELEEAFKRGRASVAEQQRLRKKLDTASLSE